MGTPLSDELTTGPREGLTHPRLPWICLRQWGAGDTCRQHGGRHGDLQHEAFILDDRSDRRTPRYSGLLAFPQTSVALCEESSYEFRPAGRPMTLPAST